MRMKQPSGPEGPVQDNGERLESHGVCLTAGMRRMKCRSTVARKQQRAHRSAHPYEGRCRAMSNAQPTAARAPRAPDCVGSTSPTSSMN